VIHAGRGPWAFALAGVAAVTAVLAVWYLFDILLLVFGAVLLATLLLAPTRFLSHRLGWRHAWALTAVLLVLTVLLVLFGVLLGSTLREQTRALMDQLPEMLAGLEGTIDGLDWVDRGDIESSLLESGPGALVGRALQVISSTFGALSGIALVLFMSVLLAAQPDSYLRGLVRLTPLERRPRLREILGNVGTTLQRWLLGQMVLMTFVAVASVIGLWLLDVRFALSIGLLAGLLTFVPFLGPLLAAGIAIVVSLGDGWEVAIWVAALYVGIQIVEGLLEPLVQMRAVSLPPVLLLFAQVALGVLVGTLGVILATPLAAALMVIVQQAYIRDVLGDTVDAR